ncbi:MAG: YhdH/YhfP family quinone oxidoreductase [Bacteroidales bacterium]|nr:YhdH/YhfP family quinone oxidoreductase [Bacteroidales bacterium]
MNQNNFKALVVEEQNDQFIRRIKNKTIDDLPAGDLLIKVHYSSLNYKDALSATGNKGVTRNYPHTPGIDAAGIIVESSNPKFSINEKVIVTSYDLGMNTSGGFSEYIRVPSEWAVSLPEGMSMQEAMIIGTAGLTAGMSVYRLTEHVKPEDGKIIVSGATGGVGILSIAILAKLGYNVVAITGKEKERNDLINLGASEVILRKDFELEDKRPMLKTQFAGGIDTVGGPILDNIIKSTQAMGVVTCCGNVASIKLNLTVFPFILRGISLVGIDSQNYPMRYREIVWNKLAKDWKPKKMMDIYTEISLEELNEKIDLILQGKLKGRTVLKFDA